MTVRALTRAPGPNLAACELTHLARVPIDAARAAAEHEAYERALAALGCTIEHLPADVDLPDSVFVEDTAVVLPEVAVITRPGAASRRPETVSVARVLGRYRTLRNIVEPATLDGGDVLRIGRILHVGLGSRTNRDGVEQLNSIVEPFGYEVRAVPIRGCLHLKSAAGWLGDDEVVLNPEWVDEKVFAGMAATHVDPREPDAANVLPVGGAVLCASAHVRTRERLERRHTVRSVDIRELAKAEAGVTCCSLVLDASE